MDRFPHFLFILNINLIVLLRGSELVLGAFRNVYEAYVIYTFIALLIAIVVDGNDLQDLVNIAQIVWASYSNFTGCVVDHLQVYCHGGVVLYISQI